MTLIDSRVTDSEQGAIYGGLRGLAIRNTIISGAGSTAIDFLGPGPGTIEYSTVDGSDGHGISNGDRAGCGLLTIRNTTVSGNGGYGLSLCGEVTVSNSTVSGNSGEWAVAFVGCDDRLRMTNSTVAGDVRIDGYCSELYPVMAELSGVLIQGSCSIEEWAEVISLNYNLESPGNTCDFDQLTDQVNVTTEALALGSLTHNGGPTETKALLPGSVAIDVIPPEVCEVDEDQRGATRPHGAACDVGAFELEVAP